MLGNIDRILEHAQFRTGIHRRIRSGYSLLLCIHRSSRKSQRLLVFIGKSHFLVHRNAAKLAECDTLERTQPTAEDYQEGVGVIRRQAQQMSRLIGQLLHITRLEQGTQKTYMERADLSALAEAVCEQQRLIAPAGTELTLDAPEP